MTHLLLIRHGEHDLLNRALAGRMPSVHLNSSGLRQVDELAGHLAEHPIRAIYASALERARESAEPLASRLGLPVLTAPEINEVDFGDWTGCTFRELHGNPEWQRFNEYRSGTPIPGGESMQAVQARMVSFLERVRLEHPDSTVAAFGHGDPIKMALMHCLSIPIDFLHRLEISTASVSTVELHEGPARVTRVNWTLERRPP